MVLINQVDSEVRSDGITAITVSVSYCGTEAEVTIFLGPDQLVSRNDDDVRYQLLLLGKALQEALETHNGSSCP